MQPIKIQPLENESEIERLRRLISLFIWVMREELDNLNGKFPSPDTSSGTLWTFLKLLTQQNKQRRNNMEDRSPTAAEKSAAQHGYCKEREYPMFAPGGGQCYSCGKQIYDKLSWKIASEGHITGCPHCHRSFCD